MCKDKCPDSPIATTKCYAQFSVRLQMSMYAHSSSLNFYKSKEKKHQKNLKCYNGKGGRLQMELE
jgi:hypothetical protein